MPEISHFLGITIRMYFNDHLPPHFHAIYNEYTAEISVETLEVIAGRLPHRVLSLVIEWAIFHRGELRRNWGLARQQQTLQPIQPLE